MRSRLEGMKKSPARSAIMYTLFSTGPMQTVASLVAYVEGLYPSQFKISFF